MNDAERYADLLDAGHDQFATPCPVCTGDESAEPCSEACEELVERVRRERQIESCKHAIQLIERMVEAYAREGFDDDTRIVVCLERVKYYEGQIAKLQEAA